MSVNDETWGVQDSKITHEEDINTQVCPAAGHHEDGQRREDDVDDNKQNLFSGQCHSLSVGCGDVRVNEAEWSLCY